MSRLGRAVALGLTLVASLALWLVSARTGAPSAPPVGASLERDVSPLPVMAEGCHAHGAEAVAYAAELEQQSQLRWERVPVMASEAPYAIAQLAEAEACFAAAGDRMGRTRAASTRRVYEAELLRRFTRARLLLRAATRRGEPSADSAVTSETRAPSHRTDAAARESVAQRQLSVLVALLERAPPSAWAYRDDLARRARRPGAATPTHERTEIGP